ncbi:hypothetical protein KFL_003460040 [Klebsormidium nitens]|uniref:JmjC domain-containing protein n=1 Tax=Klebsormidium nitens TaxID=105231 RepID=A0A1Y1I8M9_KLENI|nr:hypothetical protein KFL_003460040 [Klebsormidium nitens]|eukprot:GAQ87334.1 hypothetical protein KFL_003460040 [Klebsormidium nitens]
MKPFFLLRNAARTLSTSTASACGIRRVPQPDLETFTKSFFQVESPVIITDAISKWPAATWTPTTLASRFPDITVPVEISRWSEKLKRWGDYRDLYAEPADGWATGGEEVFAPHQEMPLSFFVDTFVLNKDAHPDVNTKWRGYLAQHSLLDENPEMTSAVIEPDYIKAGKGLHQKNVWLGPAGMSTPLHQDPYHNLFAQIHGRKYVRLYHPRDTAAMHPFQHSPLLRNTSKVDVEASETSDTWPNFVRTPFWECELQPGEMLYVPRKWWHYVRAVDTSLSISFWWT